MLSKYYRRQSDALGGGGGGGEGRGGETRAEQLKADDGAEGIMKTDAKDEAKAKSEKGRKHFFFSHAIFIC